MTKRGKKNHPLLQKECRSLSASSLVSYIEKQKSLLRKLKVSFGRKRRQEEAKVLNRQFKEDPGRVYATITMMAEEDPDNARPKYKVARNEHQTSASKGVSKLRGFGQDSGRRGGLGMKMQNGSRK